MGYWGDRAKDGDAPLDYFDEFKDKRQSANAFLREAFEECRQKDGCGFFSFFSLLGCATLMIENGYNVDIELLNQIFEKADEVDGGICDEDKEFFEAYIQNGNILKKKPMKVVIEVDVEAFSKKNAVHEASKALGVSIREWKKVKVEVKP